VKRTYADLALQLVDQVHHVLGRYRADDTRTGWISGLGEREGESHPTCGGLRIGKALPKRRRVAQPMARGAFEDGILLKSLLAMAQEGLVHYAQHGDWREPASRRLAFRELGLAARQLSVPPPARAKPTPRTARKRRRSTFSTACHVARLCLKMAASAATR
jgi:hypothetical protein